MLVAPAYSRRACSMRSQMACASSTAMPPGTTKWNSTNSPLPTVRVWMSWASMAPSALAAITRRSAVMLSHPVNRARGVR